MDIFKLTGRFVTDEDENLATLLEPLADEAERLYWVTSRQEGCSVGDWYLYDDNDDILNEYQVVAEQFRNSSVELHRPGMMSRYGRFMKQGEVAYYTGVEAENDEAAAVKGMLCGFRSQSRCLIGPPADDYELFENSHLEQNQFWRHGRIYLRFDAYSGPPFWLVALNYEGSDLTEAFFNHHNNRQGRAILRLDTLQ